MTEVTPETKKPEEKKPEKKPKKPKGPIRWEAVVPLAVICAAIGAYFTLFFDSHVRHGLEYGGSRAVGAEVDIGYLKTSFLGAELTIGGIQLTDSETPTKNALEIGRIHFKLSWDALLRAKFVVNDASIENLQVGTTRKHPGFVIKEEEKPAEAGEEKKSQALEDAAKLLGSTDIGKDLTNVGPLKSEAKIKEIQEMLNQKNEQWKATLGNLGKQDEIKALQSRLQNLKIGGTNDPLQLKAQIEEAQKALNEVNDKINAVKSQGSALSSDVSGFSATLKQIDETIKQDRAELEAKLKLPKLDVESLSTQLFGPEFGRKLGMAKKYMAMAKKYMPPKKDKADDKKLVPHERGKGHNVRFPITTGYPTFWLKRAALSSKAEGSPFGGELSGQILDVTSDPSFIKRPTLLTVKGDFPAQEIRKLDISATLDHTQEVASDMVKVGIGSFPVGEKIFTDSPTLKLGFNKAGGNSVTTVLLKGDALTINSQNIFDQVDYVVKAESGQLEEILKNAVNDVPKIAVDIRGKGSLENIQWEAESNLGGALQKSFDKQLKAKLEEAKKKVEQMINERVASEKKKLTDQFDALKAQYTGQIAAKQKEVDALKGQAQAKVDEAKKQATKSLPIPGGVQLPGGGQLPKIGF